MTLAISAALGLIASAAQAADPRFGVNQTDLVLKPRETGQRLIDEMSESGVRLLRMALREPFEAAPDIVRYANQKGIDVVMLVPTGLTAFYKPGTARRKGNRFYWNAMPLSELDLDRFATVWTRHRSSMRSAGARVLAYEIGNEINGPGFNGDFPIGPEAGPIDLAGCDTELCKRIERGFSKYVTLLEHVANSGLLDEAILVAAPMADVAPAWMRHSQGYFVPSKAAIARLSELAAGRFVDAYSVHRYPNVGRAVGPQADAMIEAQLTSAIEDCRAASGKACWLTEWGLRTSSSSCASDGERDELLDEAIDVLSDLGRRNLLPVAIYYDWSSHADLSIFRCDRLISPPAARMFQ